MATIERLAGVLAARYRIERELGQGGGDGGPRPRVQVFRWPERGRRRRFGLR